MRISALKRWSRPEEREKQSERLKKYYKEHSEITKNLSRKRSGRNHWNYKDGRTLKKYYCIDCGKEISSYQAKRCKSCASRRARKKYFSNPENRKKHKEIMNKPEIKEKISKSVSIVQKKLCKNPEHLKRKSKAALKLWQNSEFREKRIKAQSGKNSHFWIDGRSFEPYSPEFNNNLKEQIRDRDNRICQLCGKTEKENGRKLTVHHIDYNKKNCNENNLITLCVGCNSKVNTNRKFWTNYFKNYISIKQKNHQLY